MVRTATSYPGPAALGRGVVVAAGAPPPDGFADAPRYVVDDGTLADPGPLAQVLHHHWVRREPVVVELAVDQGALRRREVVERPPWELGPWFGLERERLAHRVWANSYDLRGDGPVWWRGEVATRHTALTHAPDDGPGDVLLPDGTPAWIDGGPRGPVAGVDEPLVHRESIELLRRTTVGTDGVVADGLADDQAAAVAHAAGPARVLAPAGSGKTRVLTARLHHLLTARGVEPELVTAVAYNRRAAEELRERVVAAGPGAERVAVRTIHSLAFAICRDGGLGNLLDERGVRGLLENLVTVPRVPNTDPLQPWLEALGEVRLGLRDPAQVEEERGDVEGLAEVFPRFREELDRRGAVDFDEQIVRAIELLCSDPELRDRWRLRCTHLLVDEFQDLTPAFLLLLRLLAWPDLQVFGVGDDDQVIYSYAGADPAWLLDFDLGFPAAADHRLEINYRCPSAVVDAAVSTLSHNRRRVAKTIRAATPPDPAVDGLTVITVRDQADIADAVVATIRRRLDAGALPADVAVLSRVNAALLPTQVLLGEAGVPTTAPLDRNALQRTGVRAALAYLRIAVAPDAIARGDLYETVNRPARKLRSAVTPFLKQRGQWSVASLRGIADSMSDAAAERLDGWCDDLDGLGRAVAGGADTAAVLRRVRDSVGLGEAMATLDGATSRREGSGHGDDLNALLALAAHHPDPATFAGWLVECLQRPGDPAGVHLSTVHRVKGMEWDHVVVAPASDGLFPHRLTDDAVGEEEERRVFHVAITRGRRTVTVVAPLVGTSPFVDELRSPGEAPAQAVGEIADHATRPLPTAVSVDVVTDRDGASTAVARPGLRVRLAGGVDAVVDTVGPTTAVCRALDADGVPLGVRLHVNLLDSAAAPPSVCEIEGRRVLLRSAPPATTRSGGRSASAGGQLPGLDGGSARATVPEAVEPLFQVLREWRTEQARAQAVPPYVVFNDATLQAIAERQPTNERELLGVKGVGPATLEQYADDLLAIVADDATPT
jgi:DNA helicase-2/ATP-dependent DNA helicase PcrA